MHSSGVEVPPAIPGCRDPRLWKYIHVTSEDKLREKLSRIEAHYAGAATSGQKTAAGAAADRIRRLFETASKAELSQEYKFSLPDPSSRHFFIALRGTYDVMPFRDSRMDRQTVMINAPASFVREVLWPEFAELSDALARHLLEITEKIIGDEVHAATGDAEEIEKPRRLR